VKVTVSIICADDLVWQSRYCDHTTGMGVYVGMCMGSLCCMLAW